VPRHHARFSSLETPLGKRVRAKAKKDDLTLLEVCAKLGISNSTLHRIMAGLFIGGEATQKVNDWLEGR